MPASSELVRAEAVAQLPDGVDLHARPAADFVRAAMKFTAEIRLAVGEREVDAKSLLSILALGAKGGTRVQLRAQGADALAAVGALAETVSGLR